MFLDQRSVSRNFVRPHNALSTHDLGSNRDQSISGRFQNTTSKPKTAEARKEKEKTSAIFENSSKVQHLSPCSCNKSALAQYQPQTKELQLTVRGSGKSYSSTGPIFVLPNLICQSLVPYPLRVSCKLTPSLPSWPTTGPTKIITSPYPRMDAWIYTFLNKIKPRNSSLHPLPLHLKVCYPKFSPTLTRSFWGFHTKSQKAMASSKAKKELQSARPGQ